MMEIERLTAIEGVKRLRARFARCLDSKDWTGMRETLADDCVFDISQEEGFAELAGADRIVEEISRNLGMGTTSVHHAHMPEIEIVSPNEARGVWAMADRLQFAGEPPPWLTGFGHYHETYVRVGGQWRMKSFRLTRLKVRTGTGGTQP